MSDDMKVCGTCKVAKPRTLEHFYRRASSPDGLRSDCKACGAAAGKANFKKYYQETAAERRAYQAKYRAENVEKVRERKRRYREQNAAKVAAGLRRWYESHAEERRRYTREWQRNNPDKVRVAVLRRREREANATGYLSPEDWQFICDRYGNRCLACGTRGALTVDHIVPLSKGGIKDASNVQPLCRSCNASKKEKIIDYRPDSPGYRGPDSPGYEVD